MKIAMTLALLISLTTLGAPSAAHAEGWQLDKAHSSVGFTARHLAISKVRGGFADFDATLDASPDGVLKAATATIQVASVDTGIDKRDGHLKGADFFDAAAFPTLTFTSVEVKREGATVKLIGDLTMKGKTQRITLTGEFLGTRVADFGQGPTTRAGYSFEGQINRKSFGLAFDAMAEGTAVVSDLIELHIDLQMFRPGK